MKRSAFFRAAIPVLLLAGFLLFRLIRGGAFVPDRTAERVGEGIVWRGIRYVPVTGYGHEGRTVARTKDGWKIDEVGEDPSHTFVVLRDFTDRTLLVREDYEIPQSGNIGLVRRGEEISHDAEFCRAVGEILARAEADFIFETEEVFTVNERQRMEEVYVAYGDCPVPTVYVGWLGQIDGVWRLTLGIPAEWPEQDGKKQIPCFTIPPEYAAILEKQ